MLAFNDDYGLMAQPYIRPWHDSCHTSFGTHVILANPHCAHKLLVPFTYRLAALVFCASALDELFGYKGTVDLVGRSSDAWAVHGSNSVIEVKPASLWFTLLHSIC